LSRVPQQLSNTLNIFEQLDEAYWEWDLSQDKVYYSAQLMQLLGYKNQAFEGSRKFWQKHFTACDLKQIYKKTILHFKGELEKLEFSYPLTTKDGKVVWIKAVSKVIEYDKSRASLMFGTVKNITDNKEISAKCEKQNNWLSLTEKINNTGHWRYDLKEEMFFWSSELFRIHGKEESRFTPTIENIADLFSEQDRPIYRDKIMRAIKFSEPFYFKATINLPENTKEKIEIIAEIEYDSGEKPQAVFGITKNITREENVFEKLKLLAMVNLTIKVPIFFIDDNDNVVYQDISPHHDNESSALFNYINFSITDYMSYKQQAMQQGQIKYTHVSFDKYNSVFNLSVTYEAEEGIYIWIVENVTDKFRQEQQQIISNRLTLLGNTFGNVSHDINNVLGVALGGIEMLEMKLAKGEKDISSYVERVKNAIDKGKSVTERLLAFTREPSIKVVNFDPIQEIKKNQYLFEQLLLSTIKLSFEIPTVHCTIKFPQGEFINMLLNLVLNAQDAIQEKGLSGKIIISVNLSQKNRLEIHVKDSGVGIAQENLTKIFDPFYSSKSVNKGNGIGLANVFNTMYKHNGQIQVEGSSELGGAHFTLVFKCKVSEDKPFVSEIPQHCVNLQGKHILVLDDEISIAEFVCLFLESKGALVTMATSKEELQSHLEQAAKLDIFITDMIMPELSGSEAVNIVQEKFPQINVYSMSGYIATEDSSWNYPVLRKPFNSQELAGFLSQ